MTNAKCIRTILAKAERGTDRTDLVLLAQGRWLDLALAVRAPAQKIAAIADVILACRPRTVAGHAIQAAAREWIAQRMTV